MLLSSLVLQVVELDSNRTMRVCGTRMKTVYVPSYRVMLVFSSDETNNERGSFTVSYQQLSAQPEGRQPKIACTIDRG